MSANRLVAAAGITLALCLVSVSPLFLTGCGGVSSPAASNLGRASTIIGTYSGKKTLTSGKIEETTLEVTPGTAFETVRGSYTRRVLSPRSGGGNDYISFTSGTLAGNILANGHLHVLLVPDPLNRSQATGRLTRDVGQDEMDLVFGLLTGGLAGGTGTLTDGAKDLFFARLFPSLHLASQNKVDGTWTGGPAGRGGIQLNDPRDDSPLGPLTAMSIQYVLSGNQFNEYTAAITLKDPTTGIPYTITDAQTKLYTQYDTNLKTLAGVTNLDAGQFYVVGKGTLPAEAPALPIPGLGGISLPLANRAFVFEAGVGGTSVDRLQLGTLYLKIEPTDMIYTLLPFAGVNPDATGGYIPIANFAVFNGTTPTPTPTPAAQTGTVTFSNVVGTNANTVNLTNSVEAITIDSGQVVVIMGTADSKRRINVFLGISSYDSMTVGTTYPLVPEGSNITGKASMFYTEYENQRFWNAQSGSVVVVAHDSQTTTLRVVDAAMTARDSAGTASPATGTFTINAVGKF